MFLTEHDIVLHLPTSNRSSRHCRLFLQEEKWRGWGSPYIFSHPVIFHTARFSCQTITYRRWCLSIKYPDDKVGWNEPDSMRCSRRKTEFAFQFLLYYYLEQPILYCLTSGLRTNGHCN